MLIDSIPIQNHQNLEMTQMSTNSWVDKLWYIHTMEYYTGIKKKETITNKSDSMNGFANEFC